MKTALLLLASVVAALPACRIGAGPAATGSEPAVVECGKRSTAVHADGATADPRPVLPAHLFM